MNASSAGASSSIPTLSIMGISLLVLGLGVSGSAFARR